MKKGAIHGRKRWTTICGKVLLENNKICAPLQDMLVNYLQKAS